jgi:ABC-2 type transport system ATP-binding protein
MSQKFTLYDDLSVEENIAFKAAIRLLPDNVMRARSAELLEFIGFSYPPSTLVRDLPTGVKQQVSLAATLLHQPHIVFLDEPTAGVSPAVRDKFWKLIRKLAAAGTTVIVTTHYMDEAEQCDRIALMRTGKLIALDTPEGLKKTAYPEPLAEITVPSHGDISPLEPLIQHGVITKLWPYGMRYHAVLRDTAAQKTLTAQLPHGYAAHCITPSLEDVFIRLVEGADR